MRLYRGSFNDRFLQYKIVGNFSVLHLAFVQKAINHCEHIHLDGRSLGVRSDRTQTQIIYDSFSQPFCVRFALEEDAMDFLFQFKPR